MMENVVRTETLYTYEAAVNEYERRRHHEWLCRQRKMQAIKRVQKEKRKYFCQQKIIGLIMILVSIILLLLTMEGITIFGIITGCYLMFTKKMVIYNVYYRNHSGMEIK